jgi:hypothetical protein
LATRCNATEDLEVHHKNRGITDQEGLNNISNAEVLCGKCHDEVRQGLSKPKGDPKFSEDVKKKAKSLSGNQCECEREECHSSIENLNHLGNLLNRLRDLLKKYLRNN